ncbi:MAG: TlpA family protein disulfide reductase [Treponema sp.]|nr:TlpA family protein disulfide reductase [Treponema sp.]MCL2272304.1 TlpA family protein disulfide reductase [Treponema sp.]
MIKKITVVVFFMLFCYQAVSSIETEITAEEMAEFNMTFFPGQEKITFKNIVTLDGAEYDISALRGKYVLINLGASWCPYCKKEKPSLQWLYDNYAGERFTLLTIYIGEQASIVKQYIDNNGLTIPAAVEPKNEFREIYAKTIPTSYIINAEGYIVARINLNKEWDSRLALKIINYFLNSE